MSAALCVVRFGSGLESLYPYLPLVHSWCLSGRRSAMGTVPGLYALIWPFCSFFRLHVPFRGRSCVTAFFFRADARSAQSYTRSRAGMTALTRTPSPTGRRMGISGRSSLFRLGPSNQPGRRWRLSSEDVARLERPSPSRRKSVWTSRSRAALPEGDGSSRLAASPRQGRPISHLAGANASRSGLSCFPRIAMRPPATSVNSVLGQRQSCS